MSNDSMGNLEKLGILVIVILVVVVGVVAITPSDTLFGERDTLGLPEHPDDIRPLPFADRSDEPVSDPVAVLPDEPVLPVWPPEDDTDDPQVVVNVPAPAPVPRPVDVTPEPIRTAPQFREVTVQKNDNLWRIAERELGKGSQWKVIAAANPSVDPDHLRAGQTLRIPLDSGRAALEASRGPARPSAGSADVRRYTVQSGDTPMGLSERFYGTVRHYGLLLRHNRLASSDDLRAGMTIEVPPLPETASNPAPGRNDGRNDGRDESSRAAPAAPGGRTYEVRKGDNPTVIARQQLGDATRGREILELNGIASDRELMAGARIRLPE